MPAALAWAPQVAAFIVGFEVANSLRKADVNREEVARIVTPVKEEVNFAGVVDRRSRSRRSRVCWTPLTVD